MVHPFLFIFPLRGLPGARPQEDLPKGEDPKQTQSRPINPKQPGITQGFPALFSQLAFFKASFWETPCRGQGSLYISAGLDGAPVSFHFSSSGLARGQAPRRPPKGEAPKQTQSRPINPKQPGITQGFPALFSQLAFFKASFWETPCRGRGSLYISAGLDGAPVSFHFSSSGLARGQAPRRPPKKKTQRRSLESPKAFRLYSLNLPSLRLPSGKPLAGDGAPYILARGWMVHPFLFIFPLRGLPGARPQEDLQRRRPKEEDPKQTNQPKAAWNHPRLSGSILSTCLL